MLRRLRRLFVRKCASHSREKGKFTVLFSGSFCSNLIFPVFFCVILDRIFANSRTRAGDNVTPRKPKIPVIGNPPARVPECGFAFGVWNDDNVVSAWIPLSKGIQPHQFKDKSVRCTHQAKGCTGALKICSRPVHSQWASFEVNREHSESCGFFWTTIHSISTVLDMTSKSH